MNQSNMNFLWVVMLDSNTPELYRNKVTQWADTYPNFKYIAVKAAQARWYPRIFAEYIRHDLQKSAPETDIKVITSWLDNDDMIGRDYVATVQQDAQKIGNGTFFFYRKGIQYFLEVTMPYTLFFPTTILSHV